MSDYYSIIRDVDKITDFVNLLPETKENEKFFGLLAFRKKYIKDDQVRSKFTNGFSCLRKFTFTKDTLFRKLLSLEVAKEAWMGNEGLEIPEESLVVYAFPNPRDMRKASFRLAHKLIDITRDENANYDIHNLALIEVQKSKGKTAWIDFDIDDPKFDLKELDFLTEGSFKVLKTRGGYHVLVNPKKVHKSISKSFYQRLNKFSDVSGDGMIPISGCVHGGFVPYFV